MLKARSQPSCRLRAGFTLIELLVVIAIIAILAAILFPVFAQAKAAAKKVSCLSNMKQLGTSILLYIGDTDDTYPISVDQSVNMSSVPYSFLLWSHRVYPYVKNKDIWKCPSNTKGVNAEAYGPGGSIGMDAYAGVPTFKIVYAANTQILLPWWGPIYNGISCPTQTSIDQVASKIIISETINNTEIGAPWSGLNDWTYSTYLGHVKKMNATFADGHAKSVALGQTVAPFNMWGRFDDIDHAKCSDSPYLNVNCDAVSPNAVANTKLVEDMYK